MKINEILVEKWSTKYKRSINCNNPKGFSQKAHCAGRKKNENINEALDEIKITERSDARTEIENMSVILPGSRDEYFVRFTDQDKVGFSAKQHFGRTPDVDDPDYDPTALPGKRGRPALWFYPLDTYLKKNELFASDHPYTWLVRLRPDAWLQKIDREDKDDVPRGKQRVGMITRSEGVPMEVFFRPAFDVIDRWKSTVKENFADGKKPGRKGLSKKVGVSQKMSISQLEKIAKSSSGERRRMAQWNLNMKRGRGK